MNRNFWPADFKPGGMPIALILAGMPFAMLKFCKFQRHAVCYAKSYLKIKNLVPFLAYLEALLKPSHTFCQDRLGRPRAI
jgi:hypothetical protein